jgi:hypothetical protein
MDGTGYDCPRCDKHVRAGEQHGWQECHDSLMSNPAIEEALERLDRENT